MIYKKNIAFYVSQSFAWLKKHLNKRKVQVFLLLILFSMGLNSYQYSKEDFVAMRSLGSHRLFVLVQDASKRHNIDPLLMTSVIISESSGYAFAVSYMNARGLMQLMPATAKMIAKSLRKETYKKLIEKPGAIYQPEINLDLAAIHLKDMYHYTSKKWDSALHIYNLSLGAFRKGQRNNKYVDGILNRVLSWKG